MGEFKKEFIKKVGEIEFTEFGYIEHFVRMMSEQPKIH